MRPNWYDLRKVRRESINFSLVVVPQEEEPQYPCTPSPCGPNSQCKEINGSPSCSCLPEFTGSPPNCRPECVSNSECPNHLACTNQKCRDPCPGLCGSNAECRVISHTPNCVCLPGYVGDPFSRCNLPTRKPLRYVFILAARKPIRSSCLILITYHFNAITPQTLTNTDYISASPAENILPCSPSPCGANAVCKERNGAGSCTCLPDYIGNPYEGCRPECVLNTDCPSNKACVRNKCTDPCPGTCGQNAECHVVNHLPQCTCIPGYTGDPFRYCNIPPERKPSTHLDFSLITHAHTAPKQEEPTNPCQPSPCGPNSQCREVNKQAVCSCLPEYMGSPPNCRPECVVSSECPLTKACVNQKCVDPCPGTCGLNARCEVINHSPICSCQSGYTGDPFTRCFPIPRKRFGSVLQLKVTRCRYSTTSRT